MPKYKPPIRTLSHNLMGSYNVHNIGVVHSEIHGEFVACLLNVGTRFRSCEMHNKAFIDAIKKRALSDDYDSDLDFEVDHNFFGFFTCALSGVESTVYALAMMVSMSHPSALPLAVRLTSNLTQPNRPLTLRELTIPLVAQKLTAGLPNDQLSVAISKVCSDDIFNKLVDTRNVFSHRGIPNQHSFEVEAALLVQERRRKAAGQLSPDESVRLAVWESKNKQRHVKISDHYDVVLDENTTAKPLMWLDRTLRGLLTSGQKFVDKHRPTVTEAPD